MVYFALVHPHLNYCITTWGGTSQSTLLPLFRLQKKIIRIITHSPYNFHTPPLFNDLKILPLEYLYKYNLAITFYKIQNHMFSSGTHNLIPINSIHTHQTRLSSNNNYYQPHNRTRIGQSTYSSQGISFWRKLPNHIKHSPLNSFKRQIKEYLFEVLINAEELNHA